MFSFQYTDYTLKDTRFAERYYILQRVQERVLEKAAFVKVNNSNVGNAVSVMHGRNGYPLFLEEKINNVTIMHLSFASPWVDPRELIFMTTKSYSKPPGSRHRINDKKSPPPGIVQTRTTK